MEHYEKICYTTYKNFEHVYPEIAKRVIDWYPSAKMEITLKLDDGTRYSYNLWKDVLLKIHDPGFTEDTMTEEEMQKVISSNINEKLRIFNYNQNDLSRETGINRVMINRYANSNTTPTVYNLRKIARVFKCSVDELLTAREGGIYR